MYLPNHFGEAREEELLRTVAAYPLGALVVNGPNGLDANHVPFLIDEASKSPKRLLAHVARANPLWKETKDGDEVLVIFRAEDVYVSPNWYPSKHDFHKSPDLELPRGARARQALHQGQRTVRAWRGGATYANS